MKTHELENWVLEIIDRVKRSHPIEDFRVELKAEYPAPEKAARRIAGHANAARGNHILWVIGIDEDKGVIGIEKEEFSIWFSKVTSFFDGVFPNVIDINILVDNRTVIALFFETDRAPFVVKNPLFGKADGGPIEREVPWREGTSIRTATRNDLIRILSPLENVPKFEVLSASMIGRKDKEESKFNWILNIVLYVIPPNQNPITIPFHKCHISSMFSESIGNIEFKKIRLYPPSMWGPQGSRQLSKTIESTPDEVLIFGPGKVNLEALATTDHPKVIQEIAKIQLSLLPVNVDMPATIEIQLERGIGKQDMDYLWLF